MKTSFLVMLLLVTMYTSAQAQDAVEPVAPSATDGYFTVSDPPTTSSHEDEVKNDSKNFDILWDQVEGAIDMGRKIYSLLRFDGHSGKYGSTTEPYNRMKHFGTWITIDPSKSCRNTRAEVLVRDSSVQVSMRPSGCTVATGSWDDPYTGREYTDAGDIQIDHFVPLKNAYISGADKWSKMKRCLYANFMGNKFHLLAVFGKENTKKSDRSPEGYMPPNRAYQCQYLAQWLKVKSIWGLNLAPSEKAAVESLAQDNHCTVADLGWTSSDLEGQRQFITDNMNLCQ